MILCLQKYIRVIHVRGNQIPVVNTLSRNSLPSEQGDVQIHIIIKNLPVNDENMRLLKKATQEDLDLTIVRQYVQEG